MTTIKKILVDKDSTCQSIWFMRQAGRYLPEFRKIRSQNKNFIKLCLNSDLSSEITLQPIKRYNLDSAIIFSDILLIPYALGQEVNFVKDQGPLLSNFDINNFKHNDELNFTKKLNPIYKAISQTRKKLNKEKSLISFIGAPWTLLIYMLRLKNSKNEIEINKLNDYKLNLSLIINDLVIYLCKHIENQINAGADLVQIFDSWAGLLIDEDLEKFCYNPTLKIVEFCKERKIPVICFPKGIKENYLEFKNIVKPDGLSLDYDIDPLWAKENLTKIVLQGGLHPLTLFKSDKEMYDASKKYLDIFKDVPYIFNLGHGIVPKTDPEKLNKLIKYVREYR
jgi:uroporphyrinogen decarboxylase|tara:strand:+ start:302 stop:1312 length:1011 start_codon:yes stop_codon:yes gene_type:complete